MIPMIDIIELQQEKYLMCVQEENVINAKNKNITGMGYFRRLKKDTSKKIHFWR